MGDVMRQYWMPFARSAELPTPDCAPLRVRLLGEDLIAFRVTSGSVGLVANHCPHRGASLFYGRNEDEGLRCVYHGWKFDVTGACVDMPSEPPECNFKDKVKAVAYPCQERGGVVWTYMGPREPPPPLPDVEGNLDRESNVSTMIRDCNYLQGLEGDIDTAHFAFLHTGHMTDDDLDAANPLRYYVKHRAARYDVIDTDAGICFGATRPSDDGETCHWAIGNFLLPFYTQLPGGPLGDKKETRAWVPMDDEHTMIFTMFVPLRSSVVNASSLRITAPRGRGFGSGEMVPDTTGWYGRSRPKADGSNDYLLDRAAAKRGEGYAGFPGLVAEDQAMSESMGPITDRSREHLGPSDTMIIRTRMRLLRAVRAFQDRGETPIGVETPALYRQHSGSVILPRSADWVEATRHRRLGLVEESKV
jgi:phenylpropionate dioxygenase-like ring-hydroxylating dioxygenase large terminal subunit